MAERRIILPLSKAEKPATAPNIRAAVGHALEAAADIVGREKVVECFQDITSEIVKRHFVIDPAGLIDGKCRKDTAEKINSLLTQ